MTMDDLPVELLEMILEDLWSTDLAECQLVCKKWHVAVGLKPYTKVDFNTERSLNQFTMYIQKSQSSSSARGSLVENMHFNLYQIYSNYSFASTIRALVQCCREIRLISSNKVISNVLLQSLSYLPEDVQLKRLQRVPIADDDIYYSLCARKFQQSLTELDLRGREVNNELVLNHGFPNLTKLTLGTLTDPLRMIYFVLNTSTRLLYLKFDLIQSPATSDLPIKDYPSLRKLEISSKVVNGLNHVELNKLFFSSINVQNATISIFDTINDSQPLDQAYAVRDFIFWMNVVSDSRLCIKDVRSENLLTYLAFIFNTIPPEKEDWKTKLVFLRSSYFSGPVISYSTHTSYKERTFGITLNDYFAKNLVCSYLNRLCLPFTVYEH